MAESCQADEPRRLPSLGPLSGDLDRKVVGPSDPWRAGWRMVNGRCLAAVYVRVSS